ncbi:MAG: ion transporter [Limisphaerales bacterium]
MGVEKVVRAERRAIKERLGILRQLEDWLELPMVILGFVWLLLLVLEFSTTWGARLEPISNSIWILFILDFLLKFTIAPHKLRYLQKNWLTLIALAVPALRVFRIFRAIRALRAVRAVRGIRLLRVVSSVNRGMKGLGHVLGRRGFGYAITLTVLVILAGSAGIYAFEREHGLKDFGSALWWTAMLITTMGSEYWPRTVEGRILCLLLSIYAFAVFGYVTASLASLFMENDARSEGSELPAASQIDQVRNEVAALRKDLEPILKSLPSATNQRVI